MNSSATSGSVPAAASKIRRPMNPHWPPERCCSISSPSEPSVRPEAEDEADQPRLKELVAAREERDRRAGEAEDGR